MPLKDYIRFANEETLAIISCENLDAIENLEEILSIDGLDGAFIGANDLSQDLGVPAQTNHPTVRAAIEKAEAKAFKSGKVLGSVVRAGETAQMYYDKGYLVVLNSALGLYANAARAFVAEAKK
jgi:4-hydroxy-2-oxoheptanedioate aldolase